MITFRRYLLTLIVLFSVTTLLIVQGVWAQDGGETAVPKPVNSLIHPAYPLLDADGNNVLASGKPLSTMNSCGTCHDAEFIARHSFHADLGLSDLTQPGLVENGRVWDSSSGAFGRWNPFNYRYLSPIGDEIIDLTTPEWLMLFGGRHVGGGPATLSRTGVPLIELTPDAANPETSVWDPVTGELVAWDWAESGVVEMNCFLCHTPEPNNEARIAALQAGDFQWANTATLLGTDLVEQTSDGFVWNTAVFAEDGTLPAGTLDLQGPTNENCGQCHGLVHEDVQTPLVMDACETDSWSTLTTGQVVSPQKINQSGLNLTDKNDLSRSWDIHAERVIGCTDCHHALNNPIYYQEAEATQPEHLLFDPRRIDMSDYLYRPLHQFAKGDSAQGTAVAELDNTQRRCESCHSIDTTHDWLPYKERHTNVLSCESCHIPELYTAAQQSLDWTVLNLDRTPQSTCRGVDGDTDSASPALFTGYDPVLLPRDNGDGTTSLAPHNLVSSWFWVYGDPERPVPLRALEAAWFDGNNYHTDVLTTFDQNGDGQLDESELQINTLPKERLIRDRLQAQGLDTPRILGEIQPFSINHTVTHDEWVTQDCRACHGEASQIAQPIVLANFAPGGVLPTLVQDSNRTLPGLLTTNESGALLFEPDAAAAGLYVLGHSNVSWVDWTGILLFVGTLLGVVGHGGLRLLSARHRPPHTPDLQRVYMYSIYERLWHWLQTVVILILLLTGLIIHKPDMFGAFSFRYMVQVHNIMAGILVLNAALAAFYHFASGEIRQFLPEPHGFFRQAMQQGSYYLRGIFQGEPHPIEKTRERKMNPLQQVTYLAILNILLPLQIITGAVMWGVQRWPEVAAQLGGLPFLAPFHTLIAWLFATFIVLHVYLTTTAGHTPTAAIQSMMLGWDDVEVHPAHE